MAHMLLLTNTAATRDFSGRREVFTFWWRINRSYLCGRRCYLSPGVTWFFWRNCTVLYSLFVVLVTYKDTWPSCVRKQLPILRFCVLIDRSETPRKCSSFIVEQAMKRHNWTIDILDYVNGIENGCIFTQSTPPLLVGMETSILTTPIQFQHRFPMWNWCYGNRLTLMQADSGNKNDRLIG